MYVEAHDGLVDLGYKKHYRVHHAQGPFVKGRNHINNMESFYFFSRARLVKFNEIPASTSYLHLKNSEFRFNHRGRKTQCHLAQTAE